MTEDQKQRIEEEADLHGFVVPYDGSNNFYRPNAVESYTAGATHERELANIELSEKDATIKSQQETIEELREWKRQQIEVSIKWDKVDAFVRDHPEAQIGRFVSEIALEFLKERDYWKAQQIT